MIKLQYQTAALTAFNPQVNRLPQGRVNYCLQVLISILLFPSLSLILIQPLKAAPPLSVQANLGPLNTQIQQAVQTELDQAYRRTFATLNLLLILLLVLPTASGIMALFWLSKLGETMAVARAEIESLQIDARSQLEGLIEESKTTLHHLLEQNAAAEETLKKLDLESTTVKQVHFNSGGMAQNQLVKNYAKQGERLFIEKEYKSAIDAYDKALEIQPNLAEVWNNRGVILTKLQDYPKAIDSYEKALEIRSDYPDAWNNRGVALGKLKDYQTAVTSYDRAVELKPDYGDAWNNRGFALTQLKKYDEAIQSYQKAGDLKPDFHLIWYNQARCYGLQGMVELAIKNLNKAIEIKPETIRKLAQKESDFDPIKADIRFKQLISAQ
ncbi:MAG: tetratricopeptide repeat protein [Microcoleaceae cyanobacterium]